jgi:DNA-binding LacI/PurR family transcriptional regulator
MHDVARLAGVSHQTVSRVINNAPNVREDTRERVRRAMRQLNYRPNALARGLASRRSRTIGVLGFDTRMYGPGSALLAIQRSARSAGYGVAVETLSEFDRRAVQTALDDLEAQAVDGIVVIVPSQAAARAVGQLPAGLPAVALEAEYREELPTVAIDQLKGGALATQHLLDLGHETVWHIAGPADWREAELRAEGWRAALAQAGTITPPVLRGDWTARSGYELGQRLARQPEVSAVFAANDQMALGVIHALHERGIEIPNRISIVGFDDVPGADYFTPALTTVRQDFDQLGERGLQLLIAHMEADGAPVEPTELIEPLLIERASTAPPRVGMGTTDGPGSPGRRTRGTKQVPQVGSRQR